MSRTLLCGAQAIAIGTNAFSTRCAHLARQRPGTREVPADPRAGDRPRRWTVPRAAAFWLVALAFAVTMLGTTLPTPLYVFYQRQLGLSTLMSTVVFAAYAVGVMVTLVVLRRASDAIGRRQTLLLGLACSMLSAAVFLRAHDLTLLVAGRVFSGLSAGIFTGTATATLVDLADEGAGERAIVVATMANMGGLGAGPLLAGLLAQLAPAPLQWPFAVHLALLAVVAVGVWMMPEPVAVSGGSHLPIARLRLTEPVRGTFVRASIAGFAGFAVLGLFTAVSPLFLRQLLEQPDPALSGAVASAVFVASALGQITLVRPLGYAALPVGCAVLIVGTVVLAAGLAAGSLVLLVAAAAIAGLGQGMSFRAGLAALNAAAPPGQRVEVASMFFLVLYVAISLPVVGLGLAADAVGLQATGIAFSLAVAVLAVTALVALSRVTRDG